MGDLTTRGTTGPVNIQVGFDGADIAPTGDESDPLQRAAEVPQ